ncbi:hypothetical protein D3C80_1974260 [compost metagenome]
MIVQHQNIHLLQMSHNSQSEIINLCTESAQHSIRQLFDRLSLVNQLFETFLTCHEIKQVSLSELHLNIHLVRLLKYSLHCVIEMNGSFASSTHSQQPQCGNW